MNIYEMHDTFRTFGQQMGMQINRGILPESIDAFLNNSIIEITRQELAQSTQIAIEQSGTFQASTMSSVNALRTLFKTDRYALYEIDSDEEVLKSGIEYNDKNGYYSLHVDTENKAMSYLAFSVEYDEDSKGFATHCRIISPDVIEMTLNDYCNRATKEYPIVCLYSSTTINNELNVDMNIHTSTKNLKVKYLNIKYIKVPNVVKFSETESECVNCDLPEHLHNLVVENAVLKYFNSLNGSQQPVRSSVGSNR